jgi:NitT/TauT family transport system substrate-binding protein
MKPPNVMLCGRRRSLTAALLLLVVSSLAACQAAPSASPAAVPTQAPAASKPAEPAAAAGPAVAASPVAPAAAASPAASPAAKPAGPLTTVKVAHAPSTLFAPLYVAIEKGYMAQQGIEVDLTTVPAGQDAMALVGAGQLDAVVAGFGAATFNAADRGINLKVVGSMGVQPQQGYPSAFMVRKDLLSSGQVKEMKDLKGKKIAIAGGDGSTGSFWLATKLETGGLTLKDVEIVNLAFPDQVIAFKQGAIDAAFPPAPFTTSIVSEGTADFFGGVTRPGASAVGIVYGGDFIQRRGDVARNLFVALVRGVRDIQGADFSKPENLAIYSKYTRTPVETLQKMDPYAFYTDLHPDVPTLMDMQRVFIGSGSLKLSAPLSPERWLDDSFSKYAVQQLGPIPRTS